MVIDECDAVMYTYDMKAIIDKVRTEALALSASERAGLAHDLILSLEDPADLELRPEQEIEIQRRVRLVREGKAVGRSAENVFSDIHSKSRK